MKSSRNKLRLHRKRRIRAKIFGVPQKPRLAVFRSNSGIYVQAIDDTNGHTLLSASSGEVKGKDAMSKAKEVGKLIAQKCKEKKIIEVVFDRGGYKYHGKVKALAEGARDGGLKF